MILRVRYLGTTLALLAIGLGFGLSQWRARPAPPPAPVRADTPPLAPAPTAREIVDRAEALALTREQVSRLMALDRRWRAESEGLRAAVQEAGEEFQRFMAEAQAHGGASLTEIQRRGGDLRLLSAELRERRRLHGEEAAWLLSPEQEQRLQGTTSLASGGAR
ncbi:MAG: hypothetical protein HY712_01755 [candidate division NC10 bacterium]|nr:hypothetical protein [candidate division NC10 bacterium]